MDAIYERTPMGVIAEEIVIMLYISVLQKFKIIKKGINRCITIIIL
jgi:hypothetical protein